MKLYLPSGNVGRQGLFHISTNLFMYIFTYMSSCLFHETFDNSLCGLDSEASVRTLLLLRLAQAYFNRDPVNLFVFLIPQLPEFSGGLIFTRLPSASILGFVAFIAFSIAGTRTFFTSREGRPVQYTPNQAVGMVCL